MKLFRFLPLAFAVALLVHVVTTHRALLPRTNLVIVAIDTLRADHLGCYGYDRPTSPNIDRWSQRGMRFERSVATAPWTLPSFGSIFTGLYPTRHGAGMQGVLRQMSRNTGPTSLSDSVQTLAQILKEDGYQTGAIVSNPYLEFGLERGFRDFYYIHPDSVGSSSLRWLKEDRVGPYFLFCHFNAPHIPTNPTPDLLQAVAPPEVVRDPRIQRFHHWGPKKTPAYLGNQTKRAKAAKYLRQKIALYDAMIRGVDREVGRVLEFLNENQRMGNTIVVILSDHGEEFLDHMETERERALDPRGIWGIGHGHTLFDELLHVPLLILGPGIRPEQVVAEQFSMVDLMPTLLGYLGVNAPADLDGQDRRHWIGDGGRRPLPAGAENLAYGLDLITFSDGALKLIAARDGSHVYAFDLVNDPLEQEDQRDGPLDLTQLTDDLLLWNQSMQSNPGAAAEIDPETAEQLRALGYIE